MFIFIHSHTCSRTREIFKRFLINQSSLLAVHASNTRFSFSKLISLAFFSRDLIEWIRFRFNWIFLSLLYYSSGCCWRKTSSEEKKGFDMKNACLNDKVS